METIRSQPTEGAKGETFALVGGSAFIFCCAVFGAFATFVTQILLARWMGATELGIYTFAISVYTMICAIAGLGFPEASFRFIGRGLAEGDRGRIRGYIRKGRQFTFGASVIAGTVGISLLFATDSFGAERHVTLWLIVFAGLAIFSLIRFHHAVAQAFKWFALSVVPNSVLRPLLVLVGVCAIWVFDEQLSANTVMFLYIAVMLFLALGQFAILQQRLRLKLGNAKRSYETRSWARTAAPLLIVMLFTGYFPEINVIIVGMYLPPDQVAVFNVCFRTVLLISFGLNSVNAITRPNVARLYAEGNIASLQRLVALATLLKCVGAVVGIVGLAVFGEFFLSLFGKEFVVGYPTLVILALSQLVLAAVGPVAELLSVTGHQDHCLYAFGVALPLTVVLNIALVPFFGINGSAIAVVLSVVFWTVWLHILVIRRLGINPSILAVMATLRKVPARR